jgi:hypothetical protein
LVALEKLYQKPPKALRIADFVKLRLITLETQRDESSYQRLYAVVSRFSRGSIRRDSALQDALSPG